MDAKFGEYGRIVSGVPMDTLIAALRGFLLPETGMVYSPREDDLHACLDFEPWGARLFADMPYQLGYCAGSNDRAEAMVRHGGSAFIWSETEITLAVAHRWETPAEALRFAIPPGNLIEIYGDTLRSAPLGRDFRVLVILPFATNTVWQGGPSPRNTWTV